MKQDVKNTTYTRITAKIIATMLFVTLVASLFYGEYIKREAIENLAQVDARKTSTLVFETLYAAMARGWNKDDLNTIVGRLNGVDEKLAIKAYRSTLVAALFGDIESDAEQREKNHNLKNALEGKEILDIRKNDIIDYYFPVKAQNECRKCHTNVQTNDILGVIHISYPVGELKVSLGQVINFFMIFMVIFSMATFVALFLNFHKYLLTPMRNFVKTVNLIKNSKDIKKRVSIDDNIEEIRSMQTVFNGMLDSIEYQFYNDALTGVRNRHSILEDIDASIESLLMIINIDRFQELTNLYGPEIGDRVLVELAEFLKKLLPNPRKIYRLHADEFAYLSTGEMDLREFEALATYIINAISKKQFIVDGNECICIRVTAGISYGSLMLLPNADIALKVAKKEKKHQLTYDESMQAKQRYELNINWTKRLNKALQNDKIVALYQPIAECQSGKIVKYETLMRMEDDTGEFISPIHFLELAKKNKIYHKLTIAVLRHTFETFRHSKFQFSVNLSIEDILNKEVASYIEQELSSGEFKDRMVVEIIESEGIETFEGVIYFVHKLKKLGAKISIDDFGTGYSNFEYLLKLQVDFIKIDGSMIKNITTDKNARMVTQTIVDFASKMGIRTIAEYVYSKEIYDIIKEIGVDYAQGYYFGQPSANVDGKR